MTVDCLSALQINRSVRELQFVRPLQSYEAITKVIFHKLYFITRKQAFYRDSLTFIRYLTKVPPPGILHNTILHNTHHSVYNYKLKFSLLISQDLLFFVFLVNHFNQKVFFLWIPCVKGVFCYAEQTDNCT